MKVQTPIGEITVKENGDANYPCITTYLNNIIISLVEYDALTKSIRVINYSPEEETPSNITTIKE